MTKIALNAYDGHLHDKTPVPASTSTGERVAGEGGNGVYHVRPQGRSPSPNSHLYTLHAFTTRFV